MKIVNYLKRLRRGVLVWHKSYVQDLDKSKFGFFDKTAFILPPTFISRQERIYLYENTIIRQNSLLILGNANFIMKKNSAAAHGLTVFSMNHVPQIGIPVTDNHFVDNDIDKDVVVNEDVWIGCNVTLLSGVNIGRGAIVGAGSICRKNVPPYAIVIGNPAKIIGFRFTPEQIIEHEKILYNDKDRIPLDKLERNYDKYFFSQRDKIVDYIR